jgi:RHS repeat-associated protein
VGLISSASDANGNTSFQSNDTTSGRPASYVNAKGVQTLVDWHPTLDLPVRATFPGLTVDYTYDSGGRLLSRTEADVTTQTLPYPTVGQTRTTTYSWNGAGQLLLVNGPRPVNASGQDDITTFTYDSAGNRLTMVNPLGQTVTYSNYDANGNPGQMTDPNGVSTAFAYDALGRINTITVKHPTDPSLDATSVVDYDIEGRVIGLTKPDSAKLIFDYDLAGRLLSMRSADNERIDFSHDAMNNVTGETVRRFDGTQSRAVVRTFDELGRMLSEAIGPGRVKQWSYDGNGNPVAVTTPRGNVKNQSFDALDNLVSAVAPAAGTTAIGYDDLEQPVSFTDAKAVTTTIVRNGFGDVIQESSPDRGETVYRYDAAGDLRSVTDGRGQEVVYTRDILGRVTGKAPIGYSDQEVSYDWDQPDTDSTWRIGRLTRIRDASGVTAFGYDHRGNLINQRQKLVGTADWVWLRYAYDLGDRVTRITYPSGRQVSYARDAKGRVAAVRTRANASVPTWITIASGMTYEPFGPIKAMSLGSGLRAVNDWGDDGRLSMRRLYRISDGSNLSRLTYAYDADDNITRINDTLDAAKTQKFVYDEAGRVSRVDLASGLVQRVNYVHDDNGNRLREIRRALPTDAIPLSTDIYTIAPDTNQLSRIHSSAGNRTIAYDGRGNTTSETRPGGIVLNTTYDGFGRLTGYSRSDVSALMFTYNGRDDRVAMQSDVGTRRFVYDPEGRVMGEYGLSAPDVKAEFIWLSPEVANDNPFGGGDGVAGYAPLAVVTPDSAGALQVQWVYGGHLGVPAVISDAAGAVVTTTGDYLAPGFPGQSRVLPDLYYNRYRDYDPSTGRYIQADPIGLAGGMNPYSYAGGNPINSVDPLGLRKAILFDPVNDSSLYRAASREPDMPGVCLVYGHMSPELLIAWRNGHNVHLRTPHEIHRELVRHGCEPKEPVYFLGCRAAQGDSPIAERYADVYDVTTVGSTRQTWWGKDFIGTYGRLNPKHGQPGYDTMNRNDPGIWRVFAP